MSTKEDILEYKDQKVYVNFKAVDTFEQVVTIITSGTNHYNFTVYSRAGMVYDLDNDIHTELRFDNGNPYIFTNSADGSYEGERVYLVDTDIDHKYMELHEVKLTGGD